MTACVFPERELLADTASSFPPVRRVLALAPHPDDEVFGCGGALALLRSVGAAVTVVVATDGAQGGERDASDLVAAREEESRRAADALGLAPPAFWRLPDRSLAEDNGLVDRIHAVLVSTAPDLVLLPAPTEVHPDHQALSLCGIEALRQWGGGGHVAFYEISHLLPHPNLLLDITVVAGQKRQAMECFASQLDTLPYADRIAGLNRYRAYHLGPAAASAEAYLLVGMAELACGLPDQLTSPLLCRRLAAEKASATQVCQQENELLRQEKTVLWRTKAELDETIAALQQHITVREDELTAVKQELAGVRQAHATRLASEQSHLARIAELETRIAAILGSTSWWLTAPLRRLAGLLKGAGPATGNRS